MLLPTPPHFLHVPGADPADLSVDEVMRHALTGAHCGDAGAVDAGRRARHVTPVVQDDGNCGGKVDTSVVSYTNNKRI